MMRNRDDKIADYIQSAPKGTSRRVIEDMVKKYKGDEAKISEGISAMWNKRETSANDAVEHGKWEAVVKRGQKKKERQDKPSQEHVNGGRPSTRGGRDSRGRQKSGNISARGRYPARSDTKSKPNENPSRNNNHTNNVKDNDETPSATTQVEPNNSTSAPGSKPPAASGNNNENRWSRGPPDFSRAALMQQKQQEAKKRQQAKSDVAESKEDPTPGQAFSGKGKEEIEITDPSIQRDDENGVMLSGNEQSTLAEPEKPKVPSWADRARQSAKPKPISASAPAQPNQTLSPKKSATELEQSTGKSPAESPLAASSLLQEETALSKEVVEKTPALILEQNAENRTKSVNKPEITQGEPQVPKKEPVPKPNVTQERPKAPFEKAVKLPPNFGVSSGTSFEIAFGSSHHSQTSALPLAKEQANVNVWSGHKPDSDVVADNTSADITFGSSIAESAVASTALDRSQRKFMNDLMQSSSTEEETVPASRNRPSMLSPASVVQRSLNDGTAVTVAEFESKMIAAVDGNEDEEDDAEAGNLGGLKSQEKIPADNGMSAAASQQMHQAKGQQGQQPLSMQTGAQGQAPPQRGYQPQKNARTKGPRPRISKTYSAGPRTVMQPHPLQQGQLQESHILQQPLQQQAPQPLPPNAFALPLDHPHNYGLQFQQASDPSASFSYSYGQQMNDLYGTSSYGYPSSSDAFYSQHPHSQASQHSRTTGPPPGLGGPVHPDMRSESAKPSTITQGSSKDTQSQQMTPPGQQHASLSAQQSLLNYQQGAHQATQAQQQPQPYGMSQTAAPGQYGQNAFSAPPGMNPLQYQGGMPPFFPSAYNYYGFPQYSGSQFGGPSPRSQMGFTASQRMYDAGLSGFGAPTAMYDQSNLYQYEPMSVFQHSSSANPLDSSAPLQQSQHGLQPNIGSTSDKSSTSSSSVSQQTQGPPGYSSAQSQYPYGGQQYQQQGNYFMQHQMGYQQSYNQQPSLNHPSQQQTQQQRAPVQQHQTPPQTGYGSWSSSR